MKMRYSERNPFLGYQMHSCGINLNFLHIANLPIFSRISQ